MLVYVQVSHVKVESSELSFEDEQQEQEKFPKQQQQQQLQEQQTQNQLHQQEHNLLSQQQQKQKPAADIPSRQSVAVPVSTTASTQQLPGASTLCARRLSVRQSRSSETARSSIADTSWDEVGILCTCVSCFKHIIELFCSDCLVFLLLILRNAGSTYHAHSI